MGWTVKEQQELDQILKKYPEDRKLSAVLPALYLAQREKNWLADDDIEAVAEALDISVTHVHSIIGFYTLYHDEPAGKIRIQVCTDLPCALRGADKFLEELCEALGIQPGETTPDGLITLEAVMCLAACDKAPMFQAQSGDGLEYHEHMTVEKTLELIEGWKKESA